MSEGYCYEVPYSRLTSWSRTTLHLFWGGIEEQTRQVMRFGGLSGAGPTEDGTGERYFFRFPRGGQR